MAETKENVNLMGAAAYLLGWVTGLIFLLIERENKFVRFHAMQSIVVHVAVIVLFALLWWVPFVNVLLGIGTLVLWVVLMYKAFQGEMFKVPKLGEVAEQLLAKIGK